MQEIHRSAYVATSLKCNCTHCRQHQVNAISRPRILKAARSAVGGGAAMAWLAADEAAGAGKKLR